MTWEIFFFKNQNEAGKKKALYMRQKQVACSLVSIHFDSPQNKLHKTLDYWSGDMVNFDFLENCLGIVSPPHFAYDFSKKNVQMLCSINWPSFIVWLPLLLEILGDMCVAIACFPLCDVINSF